MLESYPSLTVRQEVEALQALSGFETDNKYRILDPDGNDVLFAAEQSGFFAKQVLKNHRGLTITIMDTQGAVKMRASRNFFWYFSHLAMETPEGAPVGGINRRWKWIGRGYDITDGQSEVLTLRGPLFRPHTFFVERDGVEVGRVTKRWSGLTREAFTGADTFQVAFEPQDDAPAAVPPLTETQRWVMLGAAVAIDLDFFENKTSHNAARGGVMGGGLGRGRD